MSDDVEDGYWINRFQARDFSGRAETLRNLISQLAERFGEGDNASISFLKNVEKRLGHFARATDPETVTESQLARLDTALNQLATFLNNSLNDPNAAANWNGFVAEADAVIESLDAMPDIDPPTPVEIEESRIDELKMKTEDALRRVDSEIEKRRGEVKAFLDESIQSVTESIATTQSELDGLRTGVASQAQAIEEGNQKLQEQLNTNKTDHDALEESFRTDHSQVTAENEKSLKAVTEELKSKSASALESLERYQKEASEMVAVISRSGMAGGFKDEAETEKNDADRWRRYAVGFAIAALLLLIGAVIWNRVESVNSWVVASGRYGVAIASGGLSSYAARQSAFHRRRGNRAKQLQLELASIGAYLEVVPKTMRDIVLAALAFKYFGSDENLNEDKDAAQGPANFSEVLKIIESVKDNPSSSN